MVFVYKYGLLIVGVGGGGGGRAGERRCRTKGFTLAAGMCWGNDIQFVCVGYETFRNKHNTRPPDHWYYLDVVVVVVVGGGGGGGGGGVSIG